MTAKTYWENYTLEHLEDPVAIPGWDLVPPELRKKLLAAARRLEELEAMIQINEADIISRKALKQRISELERQVAFLQTETNNLKAPGEFYKISDAQVLDRPLTEKELQILIRKDWGEQ